MIPRNSTESALALAVSDGKVQECLLPMPGVMSSNPADTGQKSLIHLKMKWNSHDSDIRLTLIDYKYKKTS